PAGASASTRSDERGVCARRSRRGRNGAAFAGWTAAGAANADGGATSAGLAAAAHAAPIARRVIAPRRAVLAVPRAGASLEALDAYRGPVDIVAQRVDGREERFRLVAGRQEPAFLGQVLRGVEPQGGRGLAKPRGDAAHRVARAMRRDIADEARGLLLEVGQREAEQLGELLGDVHAAGQLDARAVQPAREVSLAREAQEVERRAADRRIGRPLVVARHSQAPAFGAQREIDAETVYPDAEAASFERFKPPLDARRLSNGALEQPLGRGGQRRSHR